MSKNVGLVGYRGMVGSVLVERMVAEKDFAHIAPHFFSSSAIGQAAPSIGAEAPPVQSSHDITALSKMDILISCQGGDYTSEMHPLLRKQGWKGYWLDAASTLRMHDDAVIILDPVNQDVIERALASGQRDFIGGNCTVSLMLMAIAGLFRERLVEWISTATYQAASGAGAKNMRELLLQMKSIAERNSQLLAQPQSSILDIDREVTAALRDASFPTSEFGAPLAANVLPWIDRLVDGGQTREEWKGYAETNKILGANPPIPVDGVCVRVGAMRSHGQALTIKLTRDVPLDALEGIIQSANKWVKVIPNTKEKSITELTPAAVAGTLDVAIGRLRKMRLGPQYLSAFTVGDQLLWGAAEPLRRMLRLLVD